MRIIRYGMVGSVAALLDLAVFAVFAKLLGFNYLAIGAVGFVLATALNYVLSIRYVFESGVRFRRGKEVSLVFAISGLGLLINQLVLYVGIGILGWEMILTKILATGAVFFWNFGARARFVFKPLESIHLASSRALDEHGSSSVRN